MAKLLWKKHPFRLLLYLEWVLLGIVLLASLRLYPHTHFYLSRQRIILHFGAILSIAMLGVMGLRLPYGSQLVQKIYIISGLGLSWLAVLMGGKGGRVFPTLLLIIVIRACLLLPWNGRIFVAVFSSKYRTKTEGFDKNLLHTVPS